MISKKKGINTVAWINARDAFGQSGLPILQKLAKPNGIEIVAVEDFDASATDMTVQLSKIKAKKTRRAHRLVENTGGGRGREKL